MQKYSHNLGMSIYDFIKLYNIDLEIPNIYRYRTLQQYIKSKYDDKLEFIQHLKCDTNMRDYIHNEIMKIESNNKFYAESLYNIAIKRHPCKSHLIPVEWKYISLLEYINSNKEKTKILNLCVRPELFSDTFLILEL